MLKKLCLRLRSQDVSRMHSDVVVYLSFDKCPRICMTECLIAWLFLACSSVAASEHSFQTEQVPKRESQKVPDIGLNERDCVCLDMNQIPNKQSSLSVCFEPSLKSETISYQAYVSTIQKKSSENLLFKQAIEVFN